MTFELEVPKLVAKGVNEGIGEIIAVDIFGPVMLGVPT
jgi:hypothetical protein